MPVRVRSTGAVDVAVHDMGGTGPALLVAHANGLHGRCYGPLGESLADSAHTFAVDLRGHGSTPAPPGWRADWSDMADDAHAAASALSAGGPIVGFGHSLGGAVLMMAALRQPQAFRALVVFEPIVFPPDMTSGPGNALAAGARRRRATFASFDEAYAHYRARPPLDAFTPSALRAYVDHGFVAAESGGVRLACPPEIEAAIFETATEHDVWSRLADLAPPVWVVGGRVGDDRPPASLVPGIAARIPRATSVQLDGVGHFGPLTHPGDIAAVVRHALAATAPG